jgi:polar amino acid transport system substrate-binding protein
MGIVTSAFLRAAGLALAVLAVLPDAKAAGPSVDIEYGYPEQPPRAYTNAQGQPDGIYPRLLKELFTKAGMSWRAASYPAARLMKNLESGETSFSILVRNPQLDDCCLYSKNPVWNDELRVYTTGGKPMIASKADLAGKEIILLAGFGYGGLISFLKDPANGVTAHQAETRGAAFAMLEAGRAPYLLDYGEPAQAEILSKRQIPGLRHSAIDTIHMYFVISKAYPGAQALLERLEAIYKIVREEDKERAYTK